MNEQALVLLYLYGRCHFFSFPYFWLSHVGYRIQYSRQAVRQGPILRNHITKSQGLYSASFSLHSVDDFRKFPNTVRFFFSETKFFSELSSSEGPNQKRDTAGFKPFTKFPSRLISVAFLLRLLAVKANKTSFFGRFTRFERVHYRQFNSSKGRLGFYLKSRVAGVNS